MNITYKLSDNNLTILITKKEMEGQVKYYMDNEGLNYSQAINNLQLKLLQQTFGRNDLDLLPKVVVKLDTID